MVTKMQQIGTAYVPANVTSTTSENANQRATDDQKKYQKGRLLPRPGMPDTVPNRADHQPASAEAINSQTTDHRQSCSGRHVQSGTTAAIIPAAEAWAFPQNTSILRAPFPR
jgi:hypothetical protein